MVAAEDISSEEPLTIAHTGEDGVNQIRSLLGLTEMTTNVNLPNKGQISNLPLGAIVETNAFFSDNSVTPCLAGDVPMSIYSLVARVVGEEETIVEAAVKRDLEIAFKAFSNDALVNLELKDARKLFDEMVNNTKAYLTEYFK